MKNIKWTLEYLNYLMPVSRNGLPCVIQVKHWHVLLYIKYIHNVLNIKYAYFNGSLLSTMVQLKSTSIDHIQYSNFWSIPVENVLKLNTKAKKVIIQHKIHFLWFPVIVHNVLENFCRPSTWNINIIYIIFYRELTLLHLNDARHFKCILMQYKHVETYTWLLKMI